MNIKNHPIYGNVDCEIHYARSTVDCFIETAYSSKLDRELTEDEVIDLQNEYDGDLQAHCWESGNCRNHN